MTHTRHLELPVDESDFLRHPVEVQGFLTKITTKHTQKHTKQVSVHHTNTHGPNRPHGMPMDGCSVTVAHDTPLSEELLPEDLGRCVSVYVLDTGKMKLKRKHVKSVFSNLGKHFTDLEFAPGVDVMSGGYRDSRTWTPDVGSTNSGKTRISLLREKTRSKLGNRPSYYLLVSSFPGNLGTEFKQYLLKQHKHHKISTFGELADSKTLGNYLSVCFRSNDRIAWKVAEAMGTHHGHVHQDMRELKHPNISERFYPKPVHSNVLTTVREADGYLKETNEDEDSRSEHSDEESAVAPKSSRYPHDSESDESTSSESEEEDQKQSSAVLPKLPRQSYKRPVQRVPGKFVRIYYGVSNPGPHNAFSGHFERSLPPDTGIIVTGGIADNTRIYPVPRNASATGPVEVAPIMMSTELIGENPRERQAELSKRIYHEGDTLPSSVKSDIRRHGTLNKNEINEFETQVGLENPLTLAPVASWTN